MVGKIYITKISYLLIKCRIYLLKTSPVNLSLASLWPGDGREGEASRVLRGAAVPVRSDREETQGAAGLQQGAGEVQHGVLT